MGTSDASSQPAGGHDQPVTDALRRRMSPTLSSVEWGAGVLLTLLILCFHLLAATSAGALWRDEANTVAIATLPRIGDVWKNLQYDSFPMLWMLIVRVYASLVGPMNDPAFRALGLFVGLGITGALWLNARAFGHSVPLLSLALLGMSPSMIRWGDTMRGYGFGILIILVTVPVLWRFIEKPSLERFTVAALAAIVSVNLLYYNAVLLLAFCSGAAAVCMYRRQWKHAGLVVLIGALAAGSLVPYAPTIRKAGMWSGLVRIPNYDVSWFLARLVDTLNSAGAVAFPVWVALVCAAAFGGAIAVIVPGWLNLSQKQREVALFSLVSLLVGTIGEFLFLRALSYFTQPWYYLSLLAVVAVSVDTLFGAVIHTEMGRFARVILALFLAAGAVLPGGRLIRQRLTAIDVVAMKLETIAKPGDIILVSPWYFGVTFSRYYRGGSDWVTVPPLTSHRFHRYDEIMELMRLPDQTLPARQVTDRASQSLRTGHRVFLAGQLSPPGPHVRLRPPVSPAQAPDMWSEHWYQDQASMMVSQFLTQHAMKRTQIVRKLGGVSSYENLDLQMLEGWR